jgi:AcrR family transcriptional regulator
MNETSPQRERTREELLDAARRVIARKGLLATTIVDIADEADRAPATLYRYFPSKLDLAYELARQFDSDATRPGSTARDSGVGGSDPNDVRANIRQAVVQFWHTFADQLPVAVGAYQLAMVEPGFVEEWAQIRRAVTQRFTRAIVRLQRRGECADFDAVPVASAIAGMLFHLAICTQYFGEGAEEHAADSASPATGATGSVRAGLDHAGEVAIEALTEVWFRAVSSLAAA